LVRGLLSQIDRNKYPRSATAYNCNLFQETP